MKKNFLEQKYSDLPGSKPVVRAVEKAKKDPERKFAPHSRDERIEAYLDRLDKIVEDERGWELLKNKIIKDLAIDTKDEDTLTKIAVGLYESEKRIAIEQGRSNEIMKLEDNDELIKGYENLAKEKREIQVKSLNGWLDYLKQNDAEYPTWFRYFIVRNLSKMGTLNKEKGEYSKRTDYTIAPFPEINSEALGFVYRMLTTGIGSQEFTGEDQKQKRADLEKMIEKKDFVKLYTFAQIETAGTLNRESLKGEWVKYDQGSDYHILENALRGKGTGWCTAEGSAPSHLQGGDFYVYYTKGTAGNYSEPRIAIRMQGDEIAEVRGVNHRQELEPVLIDTAQEKYHSLPGGEKFDKKSNDMKKVTELVKKQEKNEQFTKQDLVFLYEMNDSISSFGYEKDPRILELRKQRNIKEDASIIFECNSEQIAYNKDEINENTKAYIGEWNPEIAKKIPKNIEYLYESFPEKKIFRKNIELTTKTSEEYTKEIKVQGMKIYSYAQDMLNKIEPLKQKEKINLVSFSIEQLGFPNGATLKEIYNKAKKLGLELCPPQVGPELRLNYKDQLMGEWLRIAMDSIADRDGGPRIFGVECYGDGLWLDSYDGNLGDRWSGNYRFVFLSRKN
ncbi:MAG: hypothetical protein WC264_01955 [Candidatus Paceibacterota bacterium]|jgi:hypothetical protein